jgi:hypothetical protein
MAKAILSIMRKNEDEYPIGKFQGVYSKPAIE